MNDPVVEDVRRVRREIWAKFGNDPEKFFAALKEMEDEARERGFAFTNNRQEPKSDR